MQEHWLATEKVKFTHKARCVWEEGTVKVGA